MGEFDVKFIILLGIRETDNHLLKIFLIGYQVLSLIQRNLNNY